MVSAILPSVEGQGVLFGHGALVSFRAWHINARLEVSEYLFLGLDMYYASMDMSF